MRGLTGVSLPVAKHCKEAADPLFLGSAYKGARGKQPAPEGVWPHCGFPSVRPSRWSPQT